MVGHALYPTLCLLNHSCDNNVYKYFAGDTVVVIAHKNILEGEEVTEEYFPSVQVTSLSVTEYLVLINQSYRVLSSHWSVRHRQSTEFSLVNYSEH